MALNIRTERPFHYGLVGSADIMGLLAPHGRVLALECKTGGARQSLEQIRFQNMIIKFGGLYLVVRTPDEALDFILGRVVQRGP